MWIAIRRMRVLGRLHHRLSGMLFMTLIHPLPRRHRGIHMLHHRQRSTGMAHTSITLSEDVTGIRASPGHSLRFDMFLYYFLHSLFNYSSQFNSFLLRSLLIVPQQMPEKVYFSVESFTNADIVVLYDFRDIPQTDSCSGEYLCKLRRQCSKWQRFREYSKHVFPFLRAI